MASREDLRRLQVQAREYQERVREYLEQAYRSNNRKRRYNDPYGSRGATWDQTPLHERKSGFNKRFGTPVSNSDVLRFMQQHTGGNPYTKAYREALMETKRSGRATGRKTGEVHKRFEADKKEAESLQERAIKEYQKALDDANKANEARYEEAKRELSDLRSRNMDRVGNFGKAAAADLEERAAETLGNVQAGLAGRGLTGSTIGAAFEQRNARDLAREQQRLSEMVDDRSARYDQALTGDLAGLIERRQDVAPDFGSLAALLQQYGRANEGQGLNAQLPQPGYQPQPYYGIPNYGGGTSQRAALQSLQQFARGPQFAAGFNPLVTYGQNQMQAPSPARGASRQHLAKERREKVLQGRADRRARRAQDLEMFNIMGGK